MKTEGSIRFHHCSARISGGRGDQRGGSVASALEASRFRGLNGALEAHPDPFPDSTHRHDWTTG